MTKIPSLATATCSILSFQSIAAQHVVDSNAQKFDILKCFIPCNYGFTGNEVVPGTGCVFYHECWEGEVRTRKACGAPLIFNEKKDYCDFPSEVDCLLHVACPEDITGKPTTTQPTLPPISEKPSKRPSPPPTPPDTREPTFRPTLRPTKSTNRPTHKPTRQPTYKPTRRPTQRMTERPTYKPTQRPTQRLTQRPTYKPIQPPPPRLTQRPTMNNMIQSAPLPSQRPVAEIVAIDPRPNQPPSNIAGPGSAPPPLLSFKYDNSSDSLDNIKEAQEENAAW
eukprot:CAMPEP_0183759248 /NCGR_PEP_ID=MMETSP0739-20130205/6973_1 /TAXON_ID=385413 /ORGANISM="Thalassiosira miniscula, Strain CCMP1093" /LENGTH=279 /DNA_ID=CAMNT_0025997009 /DNA_START=150 /DNA_END=986 /DNA_ORIENTATION=+